MNKLMKAAGLIALTAVMLAGCGGGGKSGAPAASSSAKGGGGTPALSTPASPTASSSTAGTVSPAGKTPSATAGGNTTKAPGKTPQASAAPGAAGNEDAIQVAAQPESITALVNKRYMLPKNYEPADLVYPDVPFVFREKIEKRMMRKEAAGPLEALFAGAKKDGVALAGVSAYRSYATQTTVFNNYVKKDGLEKARTYSALPGTSEHETGLAIDVSGSDGKCAAQSCFGGTKEAAWLAGHAHEYGFIVRYPKGKESITGYEYEPWHLRFVGEKIAKEIAAKGITLEEYSDAVPVSK